MVACEIQSHHWLSLTVTVSLECLSKIPKTRWLRKQRFVFLQFFQFLTLLKTKAPKSSISKIGSLWGLWGRMLHDSVLVGDSIWHPFVWGWILHASSHHLPSVQVSLCVQTFPFYLDTVTWDQGPLWWPHLSLIISSIKTYFQIRS